MAMDTVEVAIHRAGTDHFINSDPTEIVLTPYQEQIVAATKKFTPGTPREPQKFKIIWAGENGIVRQTPNGARRFDFILVGRFDAIVDINDQFEDGKGIIEYIFPDKQYQIKAGGVYRGTKPTIG